MQTQPTGFGWPHTDRRIRDVRGPGSRFGDAALREALLVAAEVIADQAALPIA